MGQNGDKDRNLFGLVAFSALIVVVLIAVWLAWPGVNIKVDVSTVPTVLAPLMLTALFIERAVEVMISPWRDPGADRKARALKDAQKDTAAIAAQQSAADDYTQYKGKTRRYAFAFALLLGTAAAMVGVRALWPFLDGPNDLYIASSTSTVNGSETLVKAQGNPINDKSNPHAKGAFIVVDVVLSALLLAGGANGIHSVVTAFTSFFDNSAAKNQGATS